MRKATFFWMMVLGFLVMVTTASPSLAAYSAHQNDQDINNFLTVYPFAKSTKLDDCSLCHKGGMHQVEKPMGVVIIATRFTRPNHPMEISLTR